MEEKLVKQTVDVGVTRWHGISRLSIEEKSCGREVSKTDRGCWGHKMASACR